MAIQQDPTDPTGVSLTPGDKGNGTIVKARQRKADSIVPLKVQGYTNEQIAKALGYPNAGAVVVAMEKALQGEFKEMDKKSLRQLGARRLENLVRHLHDKVTNPDHPEHLAAVNTYVKVVDRWSKLMGLDAPAELIVSSPATPELQQWVEEALAAQRAAQGAGAALTDADVLDADSEYDDEEGLEEVEDEDLVEVPDAVPADAR